jgi:hypothetical protein
MLYACEPECHVAHHPALLAIISKPIKDGIIPKNATDSQMRRRISVLKSRARTRQTKPRKDVVAKAPAPPRRALPKIRQRAMTSQYFQREDEDSDI